MLAAIEDEKFRQTCPAGLFSASFVAAVRGGTLGLDAERVGRVGGIRVLEPVSGDLRAVEAVAAAGRAGGKCPPWIIGLRWEGAVFSWRSPLPALGMVVGGDVSSAGVYAWWSPRPSTR